jgi:hypothetical protein
VGAMGTDGVIGGQVRLRQAEKDSTDGDWWVVWVWST